MVILAASSGALLPLRIGYGLGTLVGGVGRPTAHHLYAAFVVRLLAQASMNERS
jgi:hypothetical protein